jgi:hypothetical protein
MVGSDRRLNPPGAECRVHVAKVLWLLVFVAAVFAGLRASLEKKNRGGHSLRKR